MLSSVMWSPSLEVNFFRAASTSSRRAGGLYSTLSTDSRDTMLKISSEQEKSGESRMVCETEQTRQTGCRFLLSHKHNLHIYNSHHSIYECLAHFTLAYLGSRGKLAIFFPRGVRKTCPSFLSTAPSSSRCSTAERTASRINITGYNPSV